MGSASFSFPEEGILISLFLEDPALWEKGKASLSPEDFRHPATREVFQILNEFPASAHPAAYAQLFSRVKEESTKSFVAGYSMKELTPQEREKAFLDCLGKMKRRRTDERLERLRRAIANAEGSGENKRVNELLEEYRSLLNQRG